MRIRQCETCHGQRLKPESLNVTVGDKNISEVAQMTIDKAKQF